MRAALYARFSTELQNVESIDDQLHTCRRHAERIGATVAGEYHDAAISGFSLVTRPGLQQLLADARAGAFDLVITEHLDRLARSGGGTWDVFDELNGLGIKINTIAHGELTRMHIGILGTMSDLFLEANAAKTRRGLEGVARQGRHAGGKVYGYRLKREIGEDGELIAGLLEVDEPEADIVRRILREYVAGISPRAIAAQLNTEGIAAPRGGAWNASTINGNAKRGNGILHNALYAGDLVWGRHAYSKDRKTGSRRAREGAADAIVRTPVPHLRLVDDGLWQAVQARYAGQARPDLQVAKKRRPKRLLSGLVRCGCCEGPMILSGPGGRIQCSNRKEKGPAVCSNGRAAKMDEVEARVLGAIRENLMHPAVVEAAVREFQQLQRQQSSADRAARSSVERKLEEVGRRADRLLDQVEQGILAGALVKARMDELEAQRAQLDAQLQSLASADIVDLHPAAAAKYARYVEDLQASLAAGDTIARAEGKEALRALILAVRVIPSEARGAYELEIVGDLADMLRPTQNGRPSEGGRLRLVMGAGAGFEPATFRL